MAEEKQVENDYREFIEILNKFDVEYLVIGSYSVIYHTKIARETKDFDIWINNNKNNAEKCARAIKEFCGLNISTEDLLGEKEIFFIGIEPNRIDIFNRQEGLSFQEAYAHKETGTFKNTRTYFISKNDLLKLKQHFGRDSDLKDIKRLKK